MTNTSKTKQVSGSYLVASLIVVIIFCLLLGFIDRETKSIADLFNLGNILALLLYALPTYIICILFQQLLFKRNSKHFFLLAHVMGIPLGFAIVMLILAARMGWF